MKPVECKIIEVFSDISGIPAKDISTKTTKDDLCFDSLDCDQLIIAVEEHLNVEFQEGFLFKFETVQDVVDEVGKLLKTNR